MEWWFGRNGKDVPEDYNTDDCVAWELWQASACVEREACAEIAADSEHIVDGRGYYDQLGDAMATASNIEEAICARGEE